MSMNKFIKKVFSWILILSTLLSQSITSLATDIAVTEIEGQMIDDIPTDDNYVYMGTSNVSLSEGDGIFSIPIYRTGDIDTDATATIRAISITARYGKDYALIGSSTEGTLKETTLMEIITGTVGSSSLSDDDTGLKVRQYEFEYDDATSSNSSINKSTSSDSITDDEGDVIDGNVTNNLRQVGSYDIDSDIASKNISLGRKLYTDIATNSDATNSDATYAQLISSSDAASDTSLSDDNISPLARLKEAKTGRPTRETTETQYHDANITEQFMNAIMPEYISQLPYACEQEISFEAGEDVAYIEFRTYDNARSDGNKTFSLYIVDADGLIPYQSTSTSILIEDDEDDAIASLSFDADSYEAVDNKISITIRRDDLTNSMATAELVAYDVGTGNKTQLGEVAFLPYETERVIDLNLDHDVILELTNLKAAAKGDITTAHVSGAISNADGIGVISVDDGSDKASSSNSSILSASASAGMIDTITSTQSGDDSSDELSFNINIKNKTYEVVYKKAIIENNDIKSAPVKGTIYDTSYDPKLEVGQYYFSTPIQYGGMYDYTLRWNGDEPFGCGTLEERYVAEKKSSGEWTGSYGSMKYYHTTAWREGTVWNTIPSGKSIIQTHLYQYIVPDICSERAMWGGQETWFTLDDSNKKRIVRKAKYGQFDRCMATDMAVRIKTGNESNDLSYYDCIYPYAAARDGGNYTPLSYVRYYGLAAMYKYYEVNIHNPIESSFIAGDSTIEAVPVQTEVASGAYRLYDKGKKDIYVSADEDKSNLVFTLRSNTVNKVDDIFCELEGYTIKVGKDKSTNQVTVNYPEDFISFINDDARKTTSLIDYSQSAKEKEIKKIKEHLNTVPMDRYFIDWIDWIQKDKNVKVSNNGSIGISESYYQALDFTPRVRYIDVDVKVTAPKLENGDTISGIAEFVDSDLKEGKIHTYHAGDKIDLSAKTNSDEYTVIGYEVSTDGGVSFDFVRSTSELVLTPGKVKGYIVRPCVQQTKNRIEIKYNSNSYNKVHVSNVIPQDALQNYPDLKGRYFLDINPSATDIYDRMKPEAGKVYSIDVIVDDASSYIDTKITRPTVTDKLSGITYNTNKYYFTARKSISDNIFYIGTESTDKSEIKDYILTGQIVMESDTVRHDGLGTRKVPIVGYTALAAGPQLSMKDKTSGKDIDYVSVVSYTVPEEATLKLSGIKAAANDIITIAVDNGISDSQVAQVKLGEIKDGTYDIGQIAITYPTTAPSINAIYYTYDNKAHTENIDLKDATIKCYDDTLNLTAEVNPNGRNIAGVKFVVQTITGKKSTYTATPKVNDDGTKSNCIFELKIPKMAEKLFNGDHIYAYIVDKDKKHIDGIGDLDIVYPTVDTGLSIYVENELVKPKYFDMQADSSQSVDLPVIGKPAANVKSGIMSFTKTKHTGDKGYSVTVNLDFEFGDTPRSPKEKQDKRKSFNAQARRIGQEREYAAIQGNEQEQIDARRNLANQIEANGRDAFDMEHQDMVHGADQAAQRQANFTDKMWMADVYILLDFEFVYDEKKDDYFLATTAVTIGGNATVSYTTYWVVGYVPVYLNFTGIGQIAATWGWATDNIKNLISEGDFNNTEGNLKNLTDADGTMTNIDTTWIGKIAGGVGVYGCLGVRAFGKIEFDIDYVDTHGVLTDDSHGPWGIIIAASAGVGVDLIVTSMELELIKAQVGFGRYEGQTSVSGIWDLDKPTNTRPAYLSASATGDDDAEEIVDSDGEYIVRRTSVGTSDFSNFANYDADDSDSDIIMTRSTPQLAEQYVLLSPAAEHTRPQIMQIKDDGTALAIFLAASQVNPSETCLYYAVGKASKWQGPYAIDDDGTFDTTPDMLKISDDKVFIAWANAREEITDSSANDDFRYKYNQFKMCAAILDLSSFDESTGYDINTFTLQDDAQSYTGDNEKFFNISPQLTMLDDTIYCTYLKRDISSANSDSEITDVSRLYSSMAYVTCDIDGNNITEEKFINISDVYVDDDDKIIDPLVTDYNVQTFKMEELDAGNGTTSSDAQYIAALYTVDTDEDVNTSDDRNIYLDIYDVTNKKNYNPIMIGSSTQTYITNNSDGSGDVTIKTSDSVSQTSPMLSKMNGKLYATWIEDGKEFVLVDITKTLNTLLETDGISDFYTNVATPSSASLMQSSFVATPSSALAIERGLSVLKHATASNASSSNAEIISTGTISLLNDIRSRMLGRTLGSSLDLSDSDQYWHYDATTGWYSNGYKWYMTEYDDLSTRLMNYYIDEYTDQGIYSEAEIRANVTDEFTKDMYHNTTFGLVSDNDINRYTMNVVDYGMAYNISEYKLTTDGNDIYIFFTGTCNKPRHTGMEIYGMRFALTGSDGTGSDLIGGFTKPVMISSDDDSDDIIDEFDIFADSDKNIYAIANTFGVKFVDESDGKRAESGAKTDNELTYYYFKPAGSMKVKDDKILFSSEIEKGKQSELYFYVENHGLYEADGYELYVDLLDASGSVVSRLYNEEYDINLAPGESTYIQVPWNVPDTDLTDYSIRVTTSEIGYDNQYVCISEIPVSSKVEIENMEIHYDGFYITVTANIHNYGNADCKDIEFRLFNSNFESDSLMHTIIKESGLKSGEDYEIEYTFIPKIEHFNAVGYMELELRAISSDEELSRTYQTFTPDMPVVCEIEDGAKVLDMKSGDTRWLKVETAPWSRLTEMPSFFSTNPEIAYVDDDGILHSLSKGETYIVVYYPLLGLTNSIKIVVDSARSDDNNSRNSGSSGSSMIGKHAVHKPTGVSGDWQYHDDGKWTFTSGGRRYASEWAYIYNPYATGNQSQYDWFRFDNDGYMITGWYKDTDGLWYYLWPYSDNLKGHMATGWQRIDGRWYYFNNISNGTKGAMYVNRWTIDGYYVGVDGAWVIH